MLPIVLLTMKKESGFLNAAPNCFIHPAHFYQCSLGKSKGISNKNTST